MRAASVGFQCPECVAEGAKTVREARTTFGGRITDDSSRVTQIVLAVCVGLYVLGLIVGERELQLRFGNIAGPVLLSEDGPVEGVAVGQYFRLLSAAFLHANLLHLVFNMLALAQLGPALEQRLGRVRYLGLYLLSALGGSTLSYLISDPGALGVGASGAIYGLFGAYFVVARRLGSDTRPIVTLIAVNLAISFAVPIIDWRAHLGGLLTGAAVAALLAYLPAGPRRTQLQLLGAAVLVALLAVAVAMRTSALAG
ncbi:MAG: rhomboid family intrarane serine protease [Frankiales bacterium]|jgi:membrane associated rhomboid family serine protease|nr:rhomboid family intrarane serine protease [Frankiales bacterium]